MTSPTFWCVACSEGRVAPCPRGSCPLRNKTGSPPKIKRYRVEVVQNLENFVANLDPDDRIVSIVSLNVPYRDMGEIEHQWVCKAVIERVS